MDSEEVLRREIADLRNEIKARESALDALQKGKAKAGVPALRFYQMRPIDGAIAILKENNGRMKRAEVEDILQKGGISIGRKRGRHNIRISIDTNLKLGNLIMIGDDLLLPKK